MGLTWVGIAVALRVAGIVHMLDVLGDLLGPVVRRKWTAVKSEEMMSSRHTVAGVDASALRGS